ncbi:hypothetical protein Csa_003784 [Cucumis sativus]|uniref:Uncharacterized protein n=1 Tax=Cucumis sativus TaxID=3659 RepID=A0A0A0KN09_CUCSA|nr:hypothetical protein Csa_003784 [Cucumis sativus]
MAIEASPQGKGTGAQCLPVVTILHATLPTVALSPPLPNPSIQPMPLGPGPFLSPPPLGPN